MLKVTEPLRLTPAEYCDRFQAWFTLARELPGLKESAPAIQLAVAKSCLLDRLLYCGEMPSRTPCPVHQGKWMGIHGPWPGARYNFAQAPMSVPEDDISEMCKRWYAAGCRCFQHKCGCTTGWQPDEHCGCLPRPVPQESALSQAVQDRASPPYLETKTPSLPGLCGFCGDLVGIDPNTAPDEYAIQHHNHSRSFYATGEGIFP